MIFLDTDMFSLLNQNDPRVRQRARAETDLLAITVITRIEVLLGRFDFVLKAADGDQLQKAQRLLVQTDRDLEDLRIIRIDPAAAAEFDKLRGNKKLKNIGRRDLLIACIALARQATVATRNLKHFR